LRRVILGDRRELPHRRRRRRRIPVAAAGVAAGSIPPASLASGRGKLRLALLCAVAFLALAAVSVVNIALPSIRRDLHMPVQNVQWILSGYLLTFGGFMLLGGRSADLFGRRRVLLAGPALFAVSSFVAGLAQSPGALIGARLAQGLWRRDDASGRPVGPDEHDRRWHRQEQGARL